MSAEAGLPPSRSRSIGALRMAIGLVQGLVLYVLYQHFTEETWLAHHPMLFRCLALTALFIPPLAISSLSHMRARKLGLWLLLLTALIVGLAIYDFWRGDFGTWLRDPALNAWQKNTLAHLEPSPHLIVLLVLGLFIAQAMALASDHDRRWIASYRSYFDRAWKLALQITFASLFHTALWIILFTGAQLFKLVRLSFLETLLVKPWFVIPVTAMAYSAALHLTDVKPAIVANLRKLLLTMLSWLLPLAVLIVTGFLVGLGSTGLQPLWETRHATAVLLGSTALLVVLINMVYQDGLSDAAPPARLIAWSLRLACVLPLPLVVLAAYALGLRVSQYGWTPDRIYATLCIAVASIYALGYLAALRRPVHLDAMAPVNVGASFAILGLLVLILTPLADPARLAVADQLARLRAGQITPQQLDMKFMRHDGQRYGVRALDEIARSQDPQLASISEEAKRTLASEHAWDVVQAEESRPRPGANVQMHPKGTPLPAAITEKDWPIMVGGIMTPGCLRSQTQECDAYLVTPPGAARAQLLLIDQSNLPTLMAEDARDQWQIVGTFPISRSCLGKLREALDAKTVQWKASPLYDLDLGNNLIPMVPLPQAHPENCAR